MINMFAKKEKIFQLKNFYVRHLIKDEKFLSIQSYCVIVLRIDRNMDKHTKKKSIRYEIT